jgi:hypothetical protein
MRRLALIACLVAGLLAASAGPAAAMPRVAKACRHAARASTAARPTPIRIRRSRRRVAVTRAKRKRCGSKRRRAVAPRPPAAPSTPGSATPPPGAPAPATPAPEDPAGGAPPVPEPESNPFAVQVRSGEFFLHLSKPQVQAGDVRVEFNNSTAEDPHDLHLFRADGTGPSYAFGELQSGGVEAKTLKLTAGAWRLICALPEHADRGMSANLRVVPG